MDERQADKVAEALLAPARESQASARAERALHDAKRARQRWIARFGLAGFCIGAATGVALGDGLFPAAMIGVALGTLSGAAFARYKP